jgi:hypothetical protein
MFSCRPSTRFAFAAALLLAYRAPVGASPIFGSLSNFDVINDTGEVCHGFEIELEGVSSSDVAFTFGNPYIRYGDPTLISTGTGVIVRYASAWDGTNWTNGTPVPAAPFTTGGHALYYPQYGGDPNYETLGGEHFGIALNGNPTNTIYRWLLGDNAGNLTPAGSNVKIPAPIWNVAPPVNNPAAPAAVQAVVPALPKENPNWEFGEALWVKVFVTESSNHAELNHLLWGDPAVPTESETEIEWQLLQAGGEMEEVDSGLNDLADGSESITRRYEFYQYIGGYDPENHEALVDDAILHPEAVGDFIGAQNAALNLDAFVVPEAGSASLLGVGLLVAASGILRRRISR